MAQQQLKAGAFKSWQLTAECFFVTVCVCERETLSGELLWIFGFLSITSVNNPLQGQVLVLFCVYSTSKHQAVLGVLSVCVLCF